MVQEIETEQKETHAIVRNGTLSPTLLSEEIMDIFLKIERAWAICADVNIGYFGYSEEYCQKNPWFLLYGYDKNRIFVNVVTQYLYDAKIMLDRLRERVDEIPEVSKDNKNAKIIEKEVKV